MQKMAVFHFHFNRCKNKNPDTVEYVRVNQVRNTWVNIFWYRQSFPLLPKQKGVCLQYLFRLIL